MNQTEYDKIIEEISSRYDIEFDEHTRSQMIYFHKRLLDKIPFVYLCEQMALEIVCEKLRPHMDLYNRVYSIHAQN